MWPRPHGLRYLFRALKTSPNWLLGCLGINPGLVHLTHGQVNFEKGHIGLVIHIKISFPHPQARRINWGDVGIFDMTVICMSVMISMWVLGHFVDNERQDEKRSPQG